MVAVVDVRDIVVPIQSPIRNAYIDFNKDERLGRRGRYPMSSARAIQRSASVSTPTAATRPALCVPIPRLVEPHIEGSRKIHHRVPRTRRGDGFCMQTYVNGSTPRDRLLRIRNVRLRS
jgi:hypothetical protein